MSMTLQNIYARITLQACLIKVKIDPFRTWPIHSLNQDPATLDHSIKDGIRINEVKREPTQA